MKKTIFLLTIAILLSVNNISAQKNTFFGASLLHNYNYDDFGSSPENYSLDAINFKNKLGYPRKVGRFVS